MKKLTLIFLLSMFLLLVFACASTEKPATDTQSDSELTDAEWNELQTMKKIVDKYGLHEYAPEDAAIADQKYQECEAHNKTDKKAAKKAYLEARARYLVVIESSMPMYTEKKKQETDKAKKTADDIKAARAVPDDYQAALDLYNQALAEKQAGNYEQSADLLAKAKAKFEEVYAKAKQKKDTADTSLDKLQKGQDEFEKSQTPTDTEVNAAPDTNTDNSADSAPQPQLGPEPVKPVTGQ